MKKSTKRCPKVWEKILEAKRRNREGLCWCQCVNDDIPTAEQKIKEGNCGGANAVIQAALKRCFASKEERDEQEKEERNSLLDFDLKPLEW